MNDTERLEWLAKKNAAIRIGGEKSPDPYWFIIYRGGNTSEAFNNFRTTIDEAVKLNEDPREWRLK